MITPEELETIEKKYYNFYLELLRKREEYIREQVKKLHSQVKLAKKNDMHWGKENPVDIPLQELIRSIFFRGTTYDPFMLSISSDTFFETEDAIIEIDVKTVKKNDDYHDDLDQIPTSPNQVSYSGTYTTDGGCEHIGKQTYSFKGMLPREMNGKPLLTFFVKFVWYWADNNETEVQIGARDDYPAFTLSSIPNSLLSGQYESLITNCKVFFGLTQKESDELKRNNGWGDLIEKQEKNQDQLEQLKENKNGFTDDQIKEKKKKLKEEYAELIDKKHKIEPEMYIKARMKYEKEYGYCMYDVRFLMTEEKIKPKLTDGWTRHTSIFDW